MPGLFNTFNILKKAINAQQYAINTTSHNIANADTDGYSVQRVTMEASEPEGNVSMNSASGPGQIGTGVDISEVTRARDEYLDVHIRNELGTSGKFKARDQFLSEIETILTEPSKTGISEIMGQMWDSWDKLSQNPQDSNARTGVAEACKTFTDELNHAYNQLDSLKNHSDELANGKVVDFNETIKQIEDLNKQITSVRITGNNPNDLLDKQDLLIDKLAGMAEIKVDRGQYGDAVITDGGETITGDSKKSLSFVSGIEKGDGTYTITYYDNGDTSQLKTVTVPDSDGSKYEAIKDSKVIWTDESGSEPEKALLGDGSIEGYTSICTEINEYENQLNVLAKGIASTVNEVHNDSIPSTDPAYVPIFTASSGQSEDMIDAGNITVNPGLFTDSSKIKTNAEGTPQTNGDKALAIADIRDMKLNLGKFYESYVKNGSAAGLEITSDSNGTILDSYYRDTISKLGSSAQQAKNMVSNQDALLNQLQESKDSTSGVSLDEEIANLMQYQNAYNAAAKAVSVVQDLLDTVISLIK